VPAWKADLDPADEVALVALLTAAAGALPFPSILADSPARIGLALTDLLQIPTTDVETEDEGQALPSWSTSTVSLCSWPPPITHVRRMLNRHEAPFNSGHVFDLLTGRVLPGLIVGNAGGVLTESSNSRLAVEAVPPPMSFRAFD
jgi:hypothetical protein